MSLFRKVFRFILDTSVVLAILLFFPGVPPYGEFRSYTIPPAPMFEGPLAANNYALNRVEKLFEGQVVGPEALEVSPVDPNTFFSTVVGGDIVKFTDNGLSMEPVVKFGEDCFGHWDSKKCGRPLGIRFDRNGQLIAADAFYGIFKVNIQTGETTTLVYKGNEVEGKIPRIFNSVAPANDGKIYYTVSSTNYDLDEGVGELLGSPSGRLMVYDPVQNISTVLKEGIHFANGIVLSPEEDYVIMSECGKYRLLKHWIKGPKKGTTEVFADGLSGFPDNLSFTPDGNIFVSLVTVRLPNEPNLIEFLYRHPWLRKLILRIMHVVKAPLDLADTYMDLPIARKIASNILNFSMLKFKPYAMILEMNWDGQIVQSWHSNKTDLGMFSEVKIIGDYMFLASPFNNYLGRLKLT